MDPVGRKIAALYPAPNQPGLVDNYASLVPQTGTSVCVQVAGAQRVSVSKKAATNRFIAALDGL